MTTLDKINGEALSVPGLRFWGNRLGERFSIIAQDERGAVEVWSVASPARVRAITGTPSYGGIEVHSPRQMYDFAAEPSFDDCVILGGLCWTDGSSLAYEEKVLPLIVAGDSRGVLQLLADWHLCEFGER